MTMAMEAPSDYPVRLDIPYPQEFSRWLPLVKWILAIPHLIILYLLNIAYQIICVIAFFAVIITSEYPKGLFDFAVGVRRWYLNVNSYIFLLRDEYPPFSWEPGAYPSTLEIDRAEKLNRFMPLIKWLLAIPHLIVLAFLMIGVVIVTIVALFAILFTKEYPRGMFDYTVGVLRWTERVNAYILFMRDEYPPFSLKP